MRHNTQQTKTQHQPTDQPSTAAPPPIFCLPLHPSLHLDCQQNTSCIKATVQLSRSTSSSKNGLANGLANIRSHKKARKEKKRYHQRCPSSDVYTVPSALLAGFFFSSRVHGRRHEHALGDMCVRSNLPSCFCRAREEIHCFLRFRTPRFDAGLRSKTACNASFLEQSSAEPPRPPSSSIIKVETRVHPVSNQV